jgi:hypothetical protein
MRPNFNSPLGLNLPCLGVIVDDIESLIHVVNYLLYSSIECLPKFVFFMLRPLPLTQGIGRAQVDMRGPFRRFIAVVAVYATGVSIVAVYATVVAVVAVYATVVAVVAVAVNTVDSAASVAVAAAGAALDAGVAVTVSVVAYAI